MSPDDITILSIMESERRGVNNTARPENPDPKTLQFGEFLYTNVNSKPYIMSARIFSRNCRGYG